MVNKIVIILCIVATLYIGIECKPLHKEKKAVLKLKLNQNDLNRGVSIQITNKPSAKKEISPIHNLPPIVDQSRGRKPNRNENQVRKGRRGNSNKRRQIKKIDSKILKALTTYMEAEKEKPQNVPMKAAELKKSIVIPTTQLMRSKRNAQIKNNIGNQELQIEDLRKLIEDDDNIEGDDYVEEELSGSRTHRQQHQMMRDQEQKQQLQFVNSEDYNDYAFDHTDTDQFNEEDDLLRRYYGRVDNDRRALFDDYDSFSDVMHTAADQSRRDTRHMKGLFYGDNDSVLNDEAVDDDDQNIDNEYDEYYDDSY